MGQEEALTLCREKYLIALLNVLLIVPFVQEALGL
eukprot:Gb_05818 [translate_table: standard]